MFHQKKLWYPLLNFLPTLFTRSIQVASHAHSMSRKIVVKLEKNHDTLQPQTMQTFVGYQILCQINPPSHRPVIEIFLPAHLSAAVAYRSQPFISIFKALLINHEHRWCADKAIVIQGIHHALSWWECRGRSTGYWSFSTCFKSNVI